MYYLLLLSLVPYMPISALYKPQWLLILLTSKFDISVTGTGYDILNDT